MGLVIVLANLVLGFETIVAVGIAALQLGIDAVGHRLEVLAEFVEGVEEAVALHIRPGGLPAARLQLAGRLLGGLLLLLFGSRSLGGGVIGRVWSCFIFCMTRALARVPGQLCMVTEPRSSSSGSLAIELTTTAPPPLPFGSGSSMDTDDDGGGGCVSGGGGGCLDSSSMLANPHPLAS